jgi:hypothetical protein
LWKLTPIAVSILPTRDTLVRATETKLYSDLLRHYETSLFTLRKKGSKFKNDGGKMRPVLLIETTKTIVYFIFFFLAIFQDIRNKALSGRFLLLFLLSGIPFFLFSLWEHFFHTPFQFTLSFLYTFYPLLLSLFLCYFSKRTENALGMGDSLFLLSTSLYLNYRSFFFFFLSGLFCSAIVSILFCLFLIGKKKRRRNITFPFLPCFLPAGLYFLWQLCPLAK